jgi:hypothetical protein
MAYMAGEVVHVLAFGFDRDTMLYVTTTGRVVEAAVIEVIVQ